MFPNVAHVKSPPQATRNCIPMNSIDLDSANACGSVGRGAAFGAAGWLGLAAAPTFAVMALLTGVQSSGQPDIFCSAMHDASPLGGMVPMYVLMAAFHLAPWLKLVSIRRSGAGRSRSGVRQVELCQTSLDREPWWGPTSGGTLSAYETQSGHSTSRDVCLLGGKPNPMAPQRPVR
jgi:hypothetical protein